MMSYFKMFLYYIVQYALSVTYFSKGSSLISVHENKRKNIITLTIYRPLY